MTYSTCPDCGAQAYSEDAAGGHCWSCDEAAIVMERERCAQIAENPGFIECRDTEWDEGVNYAKRFIAAAIRVGKTENAQVRAAEALFDRGYGRRDPEC